jgi:hypothetical protein
MSTTIAKATTTANALVFQPGKRVNFSAGMVLRATDFIQSQDYPLDKLNQHNRIEHGYGIVRGLAVAAKQDAVGTPWKITVSPGVGVDRLGRAFEVGQELCADLNAWLTKNGGIPKPETDVDGNDRSYEVYVVALYDERLTDKVAIADAPCSNTGKAEADSRITDSLKLELTKTKPTMALWEASLTLRELMKRVVITEGRRDDADALYAAIKGLSATAVLPTTTPALFYIKASKAEEVLSNAEHRWVTTASPGVYARDMQHARDSAGTPAVLLATIKYTVPQATQKLEIVAVDMTSSPRLLQTQIFQGLPIARHASAQAPRRLMEFVTVTPQRANGTKQEFELWFHLDARVTGSQIRFGTKLPSVKVLAERDDGGLEDIEAFVLASAKENNIYSITLTARVAASHMRFVFDLKNVTVNDPQTTAPITGKKAKTESELPILTYLANEGLALEGYVAGDDDAPGSVIVFVRNTVATTTTTPPLKRS